MPRRRGIGAVPLTAIPFMLLAVVPVGQAWARWSMDPTDAGTWLVERVLPSLGSFATPLIGAALLIRHPDARTRLPLVFIGALLLAAELVVLQFVAPIAAVIGQAQQADGPAVTALIALSSVFSVVGDVGWVYIARGLDRARRFKDRGPVRFVTATVVVVAIAFVLLLAALLGSYGMPTDMETGIITASAFGTSVASVAALYYLSAIVSRGWMAGEAPRRAWALAALGAWITFVSAASWVGIWFMAGPLQADAGFTVVRLLAIAAGLGPVLLLASFGTGLPDTDDITWYDLADLDAAARVDGMTGDPFADDEDEDDAGPSLVEVSDRRLER